MNMIILNDDIDQRLIIQNKFQNQGECAICYESFHMKQVVLLPCKHMFHNSCFKKTLDHRSYKCALCRFDITDALRKTGFNFPLATTAGAFADTTAVDVPVAFGNTTAFVNTTAIDFITTLANVANANATLFEFTEFDFMPALINDDSEDDTAATDTNTNTDTNTDTDTNSADTSDEAIDAQLHENFWTNILLHMNNPDEQPATAASMGSGTGAGTGVSDISYNISLLYFYL